jgi:cell division protein FtsB
MPLSPAWKRRLVSITWQSFALLLVAYFVYTLTQGPSGLAALRALEVDVAEAKEALARVSAQRTALERDVRALHPETLDPDMLDERARTGLSWSLEEDLVLRSEDLKILDRESARGEIFNR